MSVRTKSSCVVLAAGCAAILLSGLLPGCNSAQEKAEAHHNRAIAYYFMRDYDKAWADVKACQRLGGKVYPGFLTELRASRRAGVNPPKLDLPIPNSPQPQRVPLESTKPKCGEY